MNIGPSYFINYENVFVLGLYGNKYSMFTKKQRNMHAFKYAFKK